MNIDLKGKTLTIYGKGITRWVYALLLGFFVGILTLVGQKYLPGSMNSLANSGAIWLIPAFFIAVSARTKLSAISLCIETLIVCVFSYYWMESILNQHSFDWGDHYFYLWLICSVIAGAIFGLGAFFYGQKSKLYYWGASLLPAVFFAEGLNELIHLPDYIQMFPAVLGKVIIGLVLYFVIYKKTLFGKNPLLSFCVLSALGLFGYELLYRLTI